MMNTTYTTADNIHNKSNIYKKIQRGKRYFLKSELKQSGRNNFQKYRYFELGDIEPILLDFCEEENITTRFNFTSSEALLIIRDEETGEEVYYSIPLPVVETKDPRKAMQEIGSLQTYAMRYLYLQAFEIVINDSIDVQDNTHKHPEKNTTNKTRNTTPLKSSIPKQHNNNITRNANTSNNTQKVRDDNEISRTELEYAIKNLQKELKKEGLTREPEFVINRAVQKYGKDSDMTRGIRKLYKKVENNYDKKYVTY